MPNLAYKSDKEIILKWIQDGADEPDYDRKIASILNAIASSDIRACNQSLPDLTNYAGVSEVAHSGGLSYPRLIGVSHIHLFGIAFILFFIGKIFLLCDINVVV